MSSLTPAISVGVDIGGTWLRAAAIGGLSQKPLWRVRVRCFRPQDAAAVLKRIFRRKKIRPFWLTLGSTGIWTSKDRLRLSKKLKPLTRSVRVLSDMEIAWLGALGGQPGILVEAGTGSFVYGRDACGHWRREGGLGPLLGDEGSAFWIGREWIKNRPDRALRLAHHPFPVRATAAVAREVIARAGRNDHRAKLILRSAQDALIRQTKAAVRNLHFEGPISISWYGGLFENKMFRNAFFRLLAKSRRSWRPMAPRLSAETAAALMPLRFPRAFST